jgi:hypothetical protein
MGVYQDYMNHQWTRYFTDDFRQKHLRPFFYIPLGGHKEARRGAKEGNVGLNQRFQREQDTDWNSLIFDIDPEGKAPRQVLQLMQEVESRNAERYYESDEAKTRRILTLQPYCIQTTGHGSRQAFVQEPFYYNVVKDDKAGRYVINHFGGT